MLDREAITLRVAKPGELKVWKAVSEHGSHEAAAAALGVKTESVGRVMRRLSAKVSRAMSVDDDRAGVEIPEGFESRGPSTLRDADGNAVQHWDKRRPAAMPPDDVVKLAGAKISKITDLRDSSGHRMQYVSYVPEKAAVDEDRIIEILNDRVAPLYPVRSPTETAEDLMTVYPIGDHHYGMRAWAEEVLFDYDVDIGRDLLHGAMDYLVRQSPEAAVGLVCLMGDFMHWSGDLPVTPRSGHVLDADTRLGRVVEIAIESSIYMIQRALEKHLKVVVIVELGNHDGAAMIWLARSLKHIFKDNPRVEIDTSPGAFHGYAFGNVFVGTHHGHGRAAKFNELPLVFLQDFDDFAACKKRHILTGHVHHDRVVDVKGTMVESLGILPPGDAHAFNEGYRAARRMHSIWMHREFGEINRPTVTPEMLDALGLGANCNLDLKPLAS